MVNNINRKYNIATSLFYYLFESLTYNLRYNLLKKIPDIKGKKILEICCGTGSNSLILAKLGAVVTGIDLSKSQIRLANKRRKKYSKLNLRFILMDASKLDFKDGNFDLVLCSLCLHELGEIKILKQVIGEIKRVLKQKGLLLIIDYYKPASFSLSLIFLKKIFLFEPKETSEFISKIKFLNFANRFQLKPQKEDYIFFNLLKYWIFRNE